MRTFAVTSAFCAMASACIPVDPSASNAELAACPAVFKGYMTRAVGDQGEFVKQDLETKYAVYLCANQYVHPPDLSFARPFAAGGEETANFLKEKLVATGSDATVRDIVRVYAEMQRQGTYAVTKDERLMTLLAERAARIDDAYWREYVANILTQM